MRTIRGVYAYFRLRRRKEGHLVFHCVRVGKRHLRVLTYVVSVGSSKEPISKTIHMSSGNRPVEIEAWRAVRGAAERAETTQSQ